MELNRLAKWKKRAHDLKTETFALYLAVRDPRTPWYAKILAAGIVAYALSPIDIIPDFIPVLGYLDDLVIIPLGISLAIKMIPRHVLNECRTSAKKTMQGREPVSRIAGAVIIVIWLLLITLCFLWIYKTFLKD